LTTIVGIQGLLAHLMKPARQMGIIAAVGITLALALSLTFIPSFLSTMKKGRPHPGFSKKKQNGIQGKMLKWLANTINNHPKKVMLAFAVFTMLCCVGLPNFKTASDNDKVLPRKHSYNLAIEAANKHFGGTRFISVLFKGDMKDPALLSRMNNYEQALKAMPEIGSATSIATVTRIMSQSLNEKGSPEYNQIPQSREAIAQYFELYNLSGNPDDFENLVDFNYEYGLINIQFQANNMKTLNKVIDKVENLTANDPNFEALSGYSLTDKEMANAITKGQIYSLLLAIAAIFTLLSIIFKSLKAGIIGSIPLGFAVLCTFGIMGMLDIELNIVSALLSSISIGVGVDYTIHLFWRIKTETGKRKPLNEAIGTALTTTGRGIIINALSVIVGFSVLFFSAFPYLKMFALLIILSIALCLICALGFIPALCKIVQPKFLLK
ncbi:MAG TPA: efflux RND transporter permease subunit, partial [Prolixibacteraceae bacterium]|nr:efflux RND transporter permease subunit [Prolixibacteraceae bacterium]